MVWTVRRVVRASSVDGINLSVSVGYTSSPLPPRQGVSVLDYPFDFRMGSGDPISIDDSDPMYRCFPPPLCETTDTAVGSDLVSNTMLLLSRSPSFADDTGEPLEEVSRLTAPIS